MFKISLLTIAIHFGIQQDTIPLINSNEILAEIVELNANKDYSESIKRLRTIHPQDSNFINAQIVLIQTLGNEGSMADVIETGNEVLTNNIYLPIDFYIEYGNALLNNDSIESAIDIYKTGLEKFSYDNTLRYNLGYSYYRQKKYEQAVEEFTQVLNINPFHSRSHQLMGHVMALAGYRTKAILSYLTYLALDPDQNWALIRINLLVNDGYRHEGSIDFDGDNSAFEYYDNLLKSKAALDDRYKTTVELEAPVAQQCELLINKLKFQSGTEDFWMNFYVPYFQELSQEELTQAFMYFMLYSAENADVNNWIDKHEKEKKAWLSLASTMLSKNRLIHERAVLGEKKMYNHWYYDDGSLSAIGNEVGEDNDGPWCYFHSNGNRSAVGKFKAGVKVEEWKYYHDNGQLSSEEIYDSKGNVNGEVFRYSRNGNLENVGTYKNDELNGFWKTFNSCGTLNEQYPYSNGVGEGKGKVYYDAGELYIDYEVEKDQLKADYTMYYKTGKVRSESIYENGKRTGLYKSYYPTGAKYEIGNFLEGTENGPWTTFYDNGKTSNQGELIDGNKEGTWEYYYYNGKMRLLENYSDGLLNGSSIWYDEDGIIHSEREFKDGIIISYKFFDKSGAVVYEKSDPAGNMKYHSFFPTGQKKSESTLIDGEAQGPITYYHLNGNKYQEGTMKNDEWHGSYTEYDIKGNVVTICTYNEGNIVDYYRTYHSNGKVKQEGWFIDGLAQQIWKDYYIDGTISAVYYSKDGTVDGLSRDFTPDGRLYQDSYYKDGTLLKVDQYDSLGNIYHSFEIPQKGGEAIYKAPSGYKTRSITLGCGENVDDITYYHPNGNIQSNYEITTSGLDGPYLSLSPDKTILTEANYLNEERHGEWNYYHANGKLSSQYLYNAGLIEGKSLHYYDDGSLEFECEYYQGERNGPCKFYDREGNLQMIKHYLKDYGVLGYQYEIENGSLSDTIFLKTTGRDRVKALFPNGNISVLQEYNNKFYDGEISYYNSDGKLISTETILKGDSQGPDKLFYPSGKLKREVNYYFDEKNGKETNYYENGQLKEVINWLSGKQHGWTMTYDATGKLLSKTYYWNDLPY